MSADELPPVNVRLKTVELYEHPCGCVMVVRGVLEGSEVIPKADGRLWSMKRICRRAEKAKRSEDKFRLMSHLCWVEEGWEDSQMKEV